MRDERTTNYYTLLELLPSATDAELKKAWHEQIQVWHPDRFSHAPTLHQKAEARTKLLNQAYQTLSDPITRARYDAKNQPSASHSPSARPTPEPHPSSGSYASTPPRPQQTSRSSQDPRGPQSLIMLLSQQGQPKLMVPAIHLYVDPREYQPYDFHGLVRIAGTMRETLPVSGYAIAEVPDLLCIKRMGVEELYTVFSNPSFNRLPFLHELEQTLAFPSRFLVIEGTLQHRKAGGRLNQYHKIGLMDFLDALTARYGIQMIYADARDEAEERIANLAALHYAYHFAEQQGFGHCLRENDL
ncbi:MAG TPA: J domain-containing protein [Nitrospiraceae bacterium]|nr:J domain-containing protein [Nitrospiraceae bacterium]